MLKIFVKILIAMTCLIGTAHASQLPNLGNEFRSILSVRDENLIGEHWMRELRATGMLYNDPLVHEYIKYVGNRLTPYMPPPYANLRLRFIAINDKTINAFAFFGGHVAVHSGLLMLTESESELAGVMAHELAHIAQQHILRQMAYNKRMFPLALAGSIAAGLLGGPELMIPVLAGHMQQQINFTRTHEQEADRIGMDILAKAKFDPRGLPLMFERMSLNSRYQSKLPEYLLTHPLYESRISDTSHRASSLPYNKKPDSQMYSLVRARVIVQNTDNLQQLIHDLEHQLKTKRYINKLATQYSYAYALHKNGKSAEALQKIEELLKDYQDNRIIHMTAAEIEFESNKISKAQIRLENQLELHSDSSSLKLQYIELLVLTSQAKFASQILDEYAKQHETDLFYYDLRRQAESMLSNQVGVYEANAEWYFLTGGYKAAVTQLDYALGQKNVKPNEKERIALRRQEIIDLEKHLEQI